MTVDYSRFENIVLSDESDDEEVHPNIDERSFRRWKAEQRALRKKAMRDRLEQLARAKAEGALSKEAEAELRGLEEALRPRFYETESSGTIMSKEDPGPAPLPEDEAPDCQSASDDECDMVGSMYSAPSEKIGQAMLALVMGSYDVGKYLDFLASVEESKYEDLETFILVNMNENIKKNLDEPGIRLCTLSILLRYLVESGDPAKARDALCSERSMFFLQEHSKKHYLLSKDALANLKR